MIPLGLSICSLMSLAASWTYSVPSYQDLARPDSSHPCTLPPMLMVKPPSIVFQLSFPRALAQKSLTYLQPTSLPAPSHLLPSIAASSQSFLKACWACSSQFTQVVCTWFFQFLPRSPPTTPVRLPLPPQSSPQSPQRLIPWSLLYPHLLEHLMLAGLPVPAFAWASSCLPAVPTQLICWFRLISPTSSQECSRAQPRLLPSSAYTHLPHLI